MSQERQKKKARVFDPEFKLMLVNRMLAGESPTALAAEATVRRKLLYEWKDVFISRGPNALRGRGRPSSNEVLGPSPDAKTERAELLQARRRIADLERKVGHQQMQIDFFVEALRRVDAVQAKQERTKASTISSESKRGKAD